jgi:hypothetical protein
LDPDTSVIQPPPSALFYPLSCPGPGDGTCKGFLSWDAISPLGNSAPNPNSAR